MKILNKIIESIEETEFSNEQKNEIKSFIKNYKGNFKDEDIHNLANKIGLDKHEVEEYIYSIARECENE